MTQLMFAIVLCIAGALQGSQAKQINDDTGASSFLFNNFGPPVDPLIRPLVGPPPPPPLHQQWQHPQKYQQQQLVLSSSALSNRADDSDDDTDEFEDEDPSSATAASEPRSRQPTAAVAVSKDEDSNEPNPAYGESQRSMRETDDLERFFDRHLGPDDSQTNESRESRAIVVPAASGPIATIIHSLLTGRRPTITVETSDPDGASSSVSDSTKASNDGDDDSGGSQRQPVATYVPPSAGGAVVEYAAVPVGAAYAAPAGAASADYGYAAAPIGYYYAPATTGGDSGTSQTAAGQEDDDGTDGGPNDYAAPVRHLQQVVPSSRQRYQRPQPAAGYHQQHHQQHHQQAAYYRQKQPATQYAYQQQPGTQYAYQQQYHGGFGARQPTATEQHYRQVLKQLQSQQIQQKPTADSSTEAATSSDHEEPISYNLSFGRRPLLETLETAAADDEPAAESRYQVPRQLTAQLAASYQRQAGVVYDRQPLFNPPSVTSYRYNDGQAQADNNNDNIRNHKQRQRLLASLNKQIRMSPQYNNDEPAANKLVAVVATMSSASDKSRRNASSLRQDDLNKTAAATAQAAPQQHSLPANHKPISDSPDSVRAASASVRRIKRDSADSDEDGVWVDDDDEDDDDSRQTISPQSSNLIESSSNDGDNEDDDDSDVGDGQTEAASNSYASKKGGLPRTGPASYELAPEDFVVYAG